MNNVATHVCTGRQNGNTDQKLCIMAQHSHSHTQTHQHWRVCVVSFVGRFHVENAYVPIPYGFVEMKRESHKIFIRIAPSPFVGIKMVSQCYRIGIAEKKLHLQVKVMRFHQTIVVKYI